MNVHSFELKPLLTQMNKRDFSIFFFDYLHNHNIDAITVKNYKKNYQINKFFIENMIEIDGENINKLKRCGGFKVHKYVI